MAEKSFPTLKGWPKDWDNFVKSKEAQTQTQTEEEEEEEEEKNKDFILINNIGMNVSSISSFFYNSGREEIYVIINENYADPWKWFVPLSEGAFILIELQKTLNEKKDFNFHFTKTNLGFWDLF